MLKCRWNRVIMDFIKIMLKEILPIIKTSIISLIIELIETYKEENFEQLKLLKEQTKIQEKIKDERKQNKCQQL